MASLGNSVGEGHDSGFGSEQFVSTGYGVYGGAGNVRSGAEDQEGMGYDEHHQVKTRFGRYDIDYDPLTGTATRGVTPDYHFIEADSGAVIGSDVGGLTDVSLSATGHSTLAEDKESEVKAAKEPTAPEGKERSEEESSNYHLFLLSNKFP